MHDNVQSKKRIRVVCAILEMADRILLTRRGPGMRHPLQWEFPGGKVHSGESDINALRRELQEELAIEINVLALMHPVTHDYQDVHIELVPIRCQIRSGTITLREHVALALVTPADAMGMNMLEADRAVIRQKLG